MAKLTDEGENYLLNVFLKGSPTPPANLYLGLYKDASEPAETATLATITECAGAGYGRISIAQADWAISADVATAVAKTFAVDGSWGEVTGWFLATSLSGTTGKLLVVEHFAVPVSPISGDSIVLTVALRAL